MRFFDVIGRKSETNWDWDVKLYKNNRWNFNSVTTDSVVTELKLTLSIKGSIL